LLALAVCRAFAQTNPQPGELNAEALGTGKITLFNVPNAWSVFGVHGMNAAGVITGEFQETQYGLLRGFTRGTGGKFTTFDAPNAARTHPRSINSSRKIVGTLLDSTDGQTSGFIRYTNNKFLVFRGPNGVWIAPTDMNDVGELTGFLGSGAFVRATNGRITVFNPPNRGGATYAVAINSSGNATGVFTDNKRRTRGWVRSRSGKITVFDAPNALVTAPTDINAAGQITGSFTDETLLRQRGFIRDANGKFTVFDVSSVNGLVEPQAISPNGTVTGHFTGEFNGVYGARGFVRAPNGKVDLFWVKDATWTYPVSINAVGQIAGTAIFEDLDSGPRRGFIRKP
jgi:hypothetical protein